MVYLKEHFCKDIELLKPEGYNVKYSFGSVRFEKKEKDRLLRIGIGYNEYFPHSAIIKGVSAYIYIEGVEDVFSCFLDKYKIPKSYGDSTIRQSLMVVDEVNYSVFDSEIHDEKSFQIIAKELTKIIDYGALPFFEKHDTLEKVADLLSQKKPEEVVPYIQGAILFPKTILILRLARHPQFKEKLLEYRRVLELQAKKNEVYKNMLLVYDDLFSEDLKDLKL